MRITDRHQHRPQFEALESWVPLSGAAGAIEGAAGVHALAAVVQRQAQTLALSGTLHGAYFVSQTISDVGGTYQVGVAGKITPLGETGDSARLQTTGFIAQGMATGKMTIAAPRGSLTLQLTGPPQSGAAPLPTTLSYTITGGTHSYRGATGSGSFVVTLSSSVFSNRFGLMTFRFLPGSTVTP